MTIGQILIFYAAAVVACMLLPAAGFWLAFRDMALVRMALTLGFGIAGMATGALVGMKRMGWMSPTKKSSPDPEV